MCAEKGVGARSAHSRPALLPVAVRVKPGASRCRVGGAYPGPYGPALVISVNVPPVDGRATEAARRALARALGIRHSTISLRAGAASRDKLFQISEPAPGLVARIAELRGDADR